MYNRKFYVLDIANNYNENRHLPIHLFCGIFIERSLKGENNGKKRNYIFDIGRLDGTYLFLLSTEWNNVFEDQSFRRISFGTTGRQAVSSGKNRRDNERAGRTDADPHKKRRPYGRVCPACSFHINTYLLL